MIKITNFQTLIKKHNFKIQDTDNMCKKYYSINNQLLLTNLNNDKIKGLFTFLQGYYNCLNDEYICNHQSYKDEKIKETFEKLSSTYYETETVLPTNITCNYRDDNYTILKTVRNKLLMVKTEYLNCFKDCYFSVNKDENLTIINITSDFGMELQAIALAFEFVNVEGRRVELKDYIMNQLAS